MFGIAGNFPRQFLQNVSLSSQRPQKKVKASLLISSMTKHQHAELYRYLANLLQLFVSPALVSKFTPARGRSPWLELWGFVYTLPLTRIKSDIHTAGTQVNALGQTLEAIGTGADKLSSTIGFRIETFLSILMTREIWSRS